MCVCLGVYGGGERSVGECVMQAKSNVDKWKFETIYAQFTEIAVGYIKLTTRGRDGRDRTYLEWGERLWKMLKQN